jgi:hypothetical protein
LSFQLSANGENAMSTDQQGFLDGILEKARGRARQRVDKLRAQHPDEGRRQLGQRLVNGAAFRAGVVGAATGALSLVSLPVGLPAGVALTLAGEAELLLALLAVYGVESDGAPGKARLYALWAGAGFADAAKSAGLRLGADAIGRVLAGSLPARLIARLNPVLVRAILRRLGLGWVPRAFKFWPVVGAPIGFVIDRAALKALGGAALDTLDAMPAKAARPATAPRKKTGAPKPRRSARAHAPVERPRSKRAR